MATQPPLHEEPVFDQMLPLMCPDCGNTDPAKFRLTYHVIADHAFDYVDDCGVVHFEGEAEVDWQSSDDERMFCVGCGMFFELPPDSPLVECFY